MGTMEIIHAWKDPDCLVSLEHSAFDIPANPVGAIAAPPAGKSLAYHFFVTITIPGHCSRPECSNAVDCPPPAEIRRNNGNI
jgi:mersacidin/lichenicidin family type 2 lantibiotic